MKKITITIMFLTAFFMGWLSCGIVCGQSVDYSEFFPSTDDAELLEFFADPEVEWYSSRERPGVFQHDGRFVPIHRDIGPDASMGTMRPSNRFSNGNGEWPWAHPATLDADGRTKGIVGIKVVGIQKFRVTFPQIGISTVYDRSSHYERINQGKSAGIGWSLGNGTDIVELNLNRIVDGDYTFKVHRMTMMPGNEWKFRVYRPFENQESYEKATGTKAVMVGRRRVTDDHTYRAFDETRDVWKVPQVNPSDAKRILLTTSFKLCKDEKFIPTTDFEGQLYPKDYLGAFIGNATEQKNCRNCHRDVAVNVRRFANGEWYGQIRGGAKDKHGAGVFSWYPE